MASPTQLEIVPRPIILQGSRATTNFVFRLPDSAQETLTPRLHLDWNRSDLVNASHSSLSVHIDGNVVSTFRLHNDNHDRTNDSRSIALGSLPVGPHRLELTSRLSVDGDPCLKRHQEDAWLKVMPSTRISFKAPPRTHPENLSLARLPTDLRNAANGGWVQIVPPPTLTQQAARAMVEAHHLLKNWGLKVALESASTATDLPLPQVILASLHQPLPEAIKTEFRLATRLLRSAPAEAIGVVAIVGKQLALLARQEAHLPDIVRQLSQTSIRQLCPQREPCLLSRSIPKPQKDPLSTPDKATVLRLADFGYQLGWTAKGPGSHTLRFVWNRPASWKITTPPRLQLNLRLPVGTLLDRSRTHVSVVLNEHPLASWNLHDSEQARQVLRVKIPTEHWREASWAFEVAIYLAPESKLPCEAIDADAIWAVLGPESHISVNRHEPQYQGLASFYHAAQDRRPAVHWRPLDNWGQVLQLSEILYPFSLLTPNSRWDFGRLAEASSRAPRIELQPTVLDERLVSSGLDPNQFWHDTSRQLGVPVLRAETAAVLSHHDANEQHPEQLRIHLGNRLALRCPSPQFPGLLGRYAVCVDELWVGLGQESHPIQTLDIQRSPPKNSLALRKLRSEEEYSLLWVNLIWTGLSLLSLIAIALYAWRRPRTKYLPHSNIEVSDDPKPSPSTTIDPRND